MAITVPASDVENFNLQAQVTALQAAVTANANPQLLPGLTAALDTAQRKLVSSLMANAANRRPPGMGTTTSFITASGVLSANTINT
jgi:hypothetical protein